MKVFQLALISAMLAFIGIVVADISERLQQDGRFAAHGYFRGYMKAQIDAAPTADAQEAFPIMCGKDRDRARTLNWQAEEDK